MTENICTKITLCNILFFSEALTCFLCEMQPDLVLFTGTPLSIFSALHVLLISYFVKWLFDSCCLPSFSSPSSMQVTMVMRMLNLSKALQAFSYQRQRFLAITIAGTHINSQRSKNRTFILQGESTKVIPLRFLFMSSCTWFAFRKVDGVRLQLARLDIPSLRNKFLCLLQYIAIAAVWH